MSLTYHLQTDGQTEHVNQCLEIYLHCFVHTCLTKWSEWLPLAEFWYNTSYHSTLKKPPFEVLYGHYPRHFGVVDSSSCASVDLADWLNNRELMPNLLRRHLNRATQRMKAQVDMKRFDKKFSLGDWVYLKLQLYVQSSVASQANHKSAFRYFGPFQVEQKIGSVVYKLKLPSTCSIHLVIHVSQLKQALAPSEKTQVELPLNAEYSVLD